jgi:hypothetical protein
MVAAESTSGLPVKLRGWFAQWLRRAAERIAPAADEPIAVRQDGPPADWLERVRRGAPHLLVPETEGGAAEQSAGLGLIPLDRLAQTLDPPGQALSKKFEKLEAPTASPAARPPVAGPREAFRPAAGESRPKPHDGTEANRAARPGPPHQIPSEPRPPRAATELATAGGVPKRTQSEPQLTRPPRPAAPRILPVTPRANPTPPPEKSRTSRVTGRQDPWPRLSLPKQPTPSTPASRATPPGGDSVSLPETLRSNLPTKSRVPARSPGIAPFIIPITESAALDSAPRRRELSSFAEGRGVAAFEIDRDPGPLRTWSPLPPPRTPPPALPAPDPWPELPAPPAWQQGWAEALQRSERSRLALAEQKGELPSNA